MMSSVTPSSRATPTMCSAAQVILPSSTLVKRSPETPHWGHLKSAGSSSPSNSSTKPQTGQTNFMFVLL